jgi:hypothetical protein
MHMAVKRTGVQSTADTGLETRSYLSLAAVAVMEGHVDGFGETSCFVV